MAGDAQDHFGETHLRSLIKGISWRVVDSLDTRIWSASVSLDGVDVSARVVGVIEVDAEENASRIASFSLIPATGSINPI
ncbi:MAG TPA: hypothetical protein PLV04_16325, partial [Phenylobacterium sp.]|nr:hypothetical protein [Phenylobacterium sp.]